MKLIKLVVYVKFQNFFVNNLQILLILGSKL